MPRHIQQGVLGTGTIPRGGGGVRHRHEPKKGVLGTGKTQKRGGLKNWSCTDRILVTDVAQKGFLGAYLLISFTFVLST